MADKPCHVCKAPPGAEHAGNCSNVNTLRRGSPPLVPDAIVGPKSQARPQAEADGKGTEQVVGHTSGSATASLGQRPVTPGGRVEQGELISPQAGGVGDSPVRGTLVERGSSQLGPVAGGGPPGADGTEALAPLPGKSQSLQAKRLAAVARVDDRIRRRATSIVDSALRAPEVGSLPPDALTNPPPGWTKKSLRCALDATNSMKSAPAYLAMAQRVVESYKKAEADRPAAPTINTEVVQVHVSVANYPRRRLSEE